MIDHVLGRPSVKFRKIQVLAVVSFWSLYLSRGDCHGPPVIRRISALLSKKLTTWQTLVITLLYFYAARNFGKLVGLECPEPLANLYSRSYFRATWVTTALDAGFWSAMRIRRKWLRDLLSLVFSVYYMICAEQADEKVRKVRGTLTVDHLRVSWNKGTTPYLSALTSIMRPRLMRYPPRAIRIRRPKESAYKEPVHAWLYFDGPISALKKHDKVILDIPGGGFVAMDPRNHDDKLMGWAKKTELPVLSLDYRKAPEYPYPYALNECYDVYHTIIATRGRCIGLSGESEPKVVVSGDSAGGNLAVGMVLMILQAGSTDTRRWQGEQGLPPPIGVILIYPALDMNIGNWMTDEQMSLIRERQVRKTNQGILRRKSEDYRALAPNTPRVSDDEDSDNDTPTNTQPNPNPPEPTSATVLNSPQTMIRLSAAHTGIDRLSATSLSRIDTNIDVRSNSITNTKRVETPTPTPITPRFSTSAVSPGTAAATVPAPPTQHIKTRLAMSSMISYFNDRILTPEMMRAMIILYVGPHNRPDFSTDFLLSPLLAPESLLAKFPKTWMMTGERDPLVDDTVIFAGRLRQAKRAEFVFAKDMGLDWARNAEFREEEWVNVELIPGISHGFLQFVSVFPEGWKYISRCSRWMKEAFIRAEQEELTASRQQSWNSSFVGVGINRCVEVDRHRHRGKERSDYFGSGSTVGLAEAVNGLTNSRRGSQHHHRSGTASSMDDDAPLEMSVLRNSLSKGKAKISPIRIPQTNGAVHRDADQTALGRGKGRGRGKSNVKDGRRKSSVSLGSDDLLTRRMNGITGGLMGMGGIEDELPTP